jgi:hypothetical protein
MEAIAIPNPVIVVSNAVRRATTGLLPGVSVTATAPIKER